MNFPCGPSIQLDCVDLDLFLILIYLYLLHLIGKVVTGYHLLIQSTLSERILEACTCTTHCTKHWTTTRYVVLFPKLNLCSGNAMVVLNFIIATYNRMSIKFSCGEHFLIHPCTVLTIS